MQYKNFQTIDQHPVLAQFIEEEPPELPALPSDEWLARHVRQTQYTLQIRRCNLVWCCNPFRCVKFSLYLKSFIPAPIPVVFDENGPRVATEHDKDIKFGELHERLALTDCLPQPKCFDEYCPSMKEKWKQRICKICGLYFASIKRRKGHEQKCRDMLFGAGYAPLEPEEDAIEVDNDDDESRAIQELKEAYHELNLENLNIVP